MKRTLFTLIVLLALVACNANAQPTPNPSPTSNVQVPTSITQSPFSNLQSPSCTGYMYFAVNVHDWRHVAESADTLLKAMALYESNGVTGDFYLTAPMVEAYVKQRPDVIERLTAGQMTISYHIRPPHPLYPGFDTRLKNLDDNALYQTLRDYETYRLDLATGNLDKSAPGGYTYVAQVFGRKPVVVSPQTGDARLRAIALKVYAELGAQMQVLYHEDGTDLNEPLVKTNGLWVRPSDFSITRVTMDNGKENFWWNLMTSPRANEFNPTNMLKQELSAWHNTRAPFVTALVHENNFYRSGAESWTNIYYAQGDKTRPLAPPYNLNASDPSKPRSSAEQEKIWSAYEEMVTYAARNLCVVTSNDIVKRASAGK